MLMIAAQLLLQWCDTTLYYAILLCKHDLASLATVIFTQPLHASFTFLSSSRRQPPNFSSSTTRLPASSVPIMEDVVARYPFGHIISQNSFSAISPSPLVSISAMYLDACSLSNKPECTSSSAVTVPLPSLSKYLNTAERASNSLAESTLGVGTRHFALVSANSSHHCFIFFKSSTEEHGQIKRIMSSITKKGFLLISTAATFSTSLLANLMLSS
mmetsp:Transcript_66992/g.122180  ORF Transcript_66992/g.122180 Transcript_66992/m.122180 type:complete len:215 (-) Transcript_66992:1691-2335(-)